MRKFAAMKFIGGTYLSRWCGMALVALCCIVLLVACNGGDDGVCREVDELNMRAYRTRFQNLDTTEHYARLAMELATDYREGLAEACANEAFVQYMRMDYDSATTLYQRCYDLSNSLLTKAVADVGMMKICQITSQNKEFYDYRHDAELKMQRVDDGGGELTELQRMLYNYARSEFYLTVATYYNNIHQEEQGEEALAVVGRNMKWLENDTAQLARYSVLVKDYDRAFTLGRKANLPYMQASALQHLSSKVIHGESTMAPDSTSGFALALAQQALQLFKAYGSLYSRAMTYLHIADFYVLMDQPEVALDSATKALEFVNIQHMRMYPDVSDFLVPYNANGDSVPTEMLWMERGDRGCAWEWIAGIRQRLSIVYSSLGMKAESDYNRNIYLDILEATRQDRMLEYQLEELSKEEQSQKLLLVLVLVLSVVIVFGVFVYVKLLKRSAQRRYAGELDRVEKAFQQWMSDNEAIYNSMDEEARRIDSETYMHEQHIAENKRSFIDKCTSLDMVGSITPFLDRAINQLDKLRNADETDDVRRQRMQYLEELIDRINLYNEILSHWIKIRQGMMSLNIENFALQPLLDTISRNKNTFQNKGQTLAVATSDAVVKADRPLTLFMMNTLLDNARKYTPEGGKVSIDTLQTDEYVEISVSDTGRGLSEADIRTLMNEKVYDSSKIGNPDADEELKKSKGFGFGLMNCKGIIEKYKKTNALFAVCKFGVESEVGKGSRFYFRLPKGVLRFIVFAMLSVSLCANAQPQMEDLPDNIHLDLANSFADSVFYANVDGMYEMALEYADSVLAQLNAFYLEQYPDGTDLLQLCAKGSYPDSKLWNMGFKTNYMALIDMRNEVAIAALALKRWDVYEYNNDIYSHLVKLATYDTNLEAACNSLHKANVTRQTLTVVMIMLVVIGIIIFIVIYYRLQLLPTFNMRQLMQFNNSLLTVPYDQALGYVMRGINDIKPIDGVMLGTLDHETNRLRTAATPHFPIAEATESLMERSMQEQKEYSTAEPHIVVYPLGVEAEDDDSVETFEASKPRSLETSENPEGKPAKKLVGAMAVAFKSKSMQENDAQIIKQMAGHIATYIYYTTIRVESQKALIQLKADEQLRAAKEEANIHIQNMVLDNCLSSIKHETMYYPSRIKKIIDGINADSASSIQPAALNDLNELTLYYKEVFSLLCSCATRQLDNVMFKRKTIAAADLAAYAKRQMSKQAKKRGIDIRFSIDNPNDRLSIAGDRKMLEYLIDNLITLALHTEDDGDISLSFSRRDGFVCISFADNRVSMSQEEMAQLFYIDHLHYDDDNDRLEGIEYLVCRQIVRQHDEYGGRRGCRITPHMRDGAFCIDIMLNGKS